MTRRVLLIDEPLSQLDPVAATSFCSILGRICRELGITVVLITHNMDEAVDADRVLVMNKGNIVLSGKPREVFSCVSKMKEYGLDVPQPTEIAYELKNDGFDIQTDILTEDELIAEIERLTQ